MSIFDVDAARRAKVRGKPLTEAVSGWDRSLDDAALAEAVAQRERVLALFPIDEWPVLPLERYALGTDVDESFCKLMEFRTNSLGGIGGGSAMKHLIFRRSKDGSWYHRPEYANEQAAWEAVRSDFITAFQLAGQGRWSDIDALPAIRPASSLRGKSIFTYFPGELLPIYGTGAQAHYYQELGGEGTPPDGVAGSRELLRLARETGVFDDWQPLQIAVFLWAWSSPSFTRRIVKIAPGERAHLWDDCKANGYIRVGWEGTGDLKAFDSKEHFRSAFATSYPKYSAPKASAKANEVWTLMELQPGDTVVANEGTSRIAGIGEVVEPGYEFRPDLGEYGHTVRVKWQDRPGWNIDPVKGWGLVTVAPVSAEQYKRISEGVHKGGVGTPPNPPVDVPPDPVFGDIDAALERKKQVILYGPPGTGKTYHARRFGVWWLSREAKWPETEALLGDRAILEEVERRLGRPESSQRTWVMVANPARWSWQQLESEGDVEFGFGRIEKNFGLAEVGDLVIGYQARPDKKIVALAEISAGLHAGSEGRAVRVRPVAGVADGPSWAELEADPLLAGSEPVKRRMLGTVFALSQVEADHLLALIQERNPELAIAGRWGDDVGQLTRVTFHPSYTYEDFVEGYKPVPSSSGQLNLQLTDGIFKRVCQAARAAPDKTFILLIDEINRGNIPKIFGELITLLEKDKRGVSVTLPQSREPFSVPRNLLIVGTMNTADRSIKLLDAALRRRFAFIELMPNPELLRGGRAGDLDLEVFLQELNRLIVKSEGREKQIGHSFLMDGDVPMSSDSDFAHAFRSEILPLLQEYSYDDYRELESFIGPRLVDVDAQVVNKDVLGSPEQLIAALHDKFQPREAAEDVSELAPTENTAAAGLA